MSGITTHVLDTSAGQPAADVAVQLARRAADGQWHPLTTGRTNADGRVLDWSPSVGDVTAGDYRLSFATAEYFQGRGVASFFPEVQVVFAVVDTARHYHIPLLLSPFGYSTYRGS
jgi:5-hydroxyisourate hydrolase